MLSRSENPTIIVETTPTSTIASGFRINDPVFIYVFTKFPYYYYIPSQT